jgi:hypothetical protein
MRAILRNIFALMPGLAQQAVSLRRSRVHGRPAVWRHCFGDADLPFDDDVQKGAGAALLDDHVPGFEGAFIGSAERRDEFLLGQAFKYLGLRQITDALRPISSAR